MTESEINISKMVLYEGLLFLRNIRPRGVKEKIAVLAEMKAPLEYQVKAH